MMCATLADKGESILFRTYDAPADAEPVSGSAKDRFGSGTLAKIPITEAALATSAAPTYLPEVIWERLKFWDGGLLNNNPINQLWAARYDLAATTTDPPSPIDCVVSLGTS
jgi:predicted acylesterase/phospholipase RssA